MLARWVGVQGGSELRKPTRPALIVFPEDVHVLHDVNCIFARLWSEMRPSLSLAVVVRNKFKYCLPVFITFSFVFPIFEGE